MRSVAGPRGWTTTLGLRNDTYSYEEAAVENCAQSCYKLDMLAYRVGCYDLRGGTQWRPPTSPIFQNSPSERCAWHVLITSKEKRYHNVQLKCLVLFYFINLKFYHAIKKIS